MLHIRQKNTPTKPNITCLQKDALLQHPRLVQGQIYASRTVEKTALFRSLARSTLPRLQKKAPTPSFAFRSSHTAEEVFDTLFHLCSIRSTFPIQQKKPPALSFACLHASNTAEEAFDALLHLCSIRSTLPTQQKKPPALSFAGLVLYLFSTL